MLIRCSWCSRDDVADQMRAEAARAAELLIRFRHGLMCPSLQAQDIVPVSGCLPALIARDRRRP